jgi:hypothetical protein
MIAPATFISLREAQRVQRPVVDYTLARRALMQLPRLVGFGSIAGNRQPNSIPIIEPLPAV